MSAHRREYEVMLPVGYLDDSGRIHRRAFLRKMRGHEEALFYDTSLSSGRLVSELIRSCLVRIDEERNITTDLVAGLYSADRNYLLMELRRITLGDTVHCTYVCPGCSREVAVVEDLGRLEVRRTAADERPAPIAVELEDGYEDRDGQMHTALRLRLPRGTDEEFVAGATDLDPLRARDVLLLRCIESFGTLGRPVLEGYGIKVLRDLTLGDRKRIFQTLEDSTPGVNFRRTNRCGECGTSFNTMLETSRFFELG